MTNSEREAQLIETFAKLADTLVADFEVVDLLQELVETCTTLLDATAAGILLADERGQLELVASTSEATSLVEVMQVSADAGPCIESFRTGQMIAVKDIRETDERWSRFRTSALENGFGSTYAIPMRLRESTIGTLNLFRNDYGELDPKDVLAARAFADVATLGILQQRAIQASNEVRGQLQRALTSRVIIEQAKGVIAYKNNLSMDDAFDLLRSHARANRLGLAETALLVVERKLSL